MDPRVLRIPHRRKPDSHSLGRRCCFLCPTLRARPSLTAKERSGPDANGEPSEVEAAEVGGTDGRALSPRPAFSHPRSLERSAFLSASRVPVRRMPPMAESGRATRLARAVVHPEIRPSARVESLSTDSNCGFLGHELRCAPPAAAPSWPTRDPPCTFPAPSLHPPCAPSPQRPRTVPAPALFLGPSGRSQGVPGGGPRRPRRTGAQCWKPAGAASVPWPLDRGAREICLLRVPGSSSSRPRGVRGAQGVSRQRFTNRSGV